MGSRAGLKRAATGILYFRAMFFNIGGYNNNRSAVVAIYNALIVNHCKLVRKRYLSVRISESIWVESVCMCVCEDCFRTLAVVEFTSGPGSLVGGGRAGSSGRQYRVFFFRKNDNNARQRFEEMKSLQQSESVSGRVLFIVIITIIIIIINRNYIYILICRYISLSVFATRRSKFKWARLNAFTLFHLFIEARHCCFKKYLCYPNLDPI